MTRLRTIAALTLLWAGPALAEYALPEQDEGVQQDDRRGAQVDLDLRFHDHTGKVVRLGDYFQDDKPVLLTLNYYQCKMLCTEQLNGLVKSLRTLDWTAGDRFNLVTASIDFREGLPLAAGKHETYLGEYDRDGAEWSFLTGTHESIQSLTQAVGFNFKYDRETNQYAHPPVIMFLSPDGKVMQYLFGKEFKSRDMKFALMDASRGKVAGVFEQLVWSCFHYDESTGAYTPFAFGIMRLGGALIMLLLGGALFIFWRRERQNMPSNRTQMTEQMT